MSDMPLKQVIDATLENLKKVMSTDTVVGEPLKVLDDTVVIPISKVSVGFTSGGVDFDSKKQTNSGAHFGGGNGAGMSINPIAFLVISKNDVRMLNVNANDPQSNLVSSISDLIEKSPELIEKFKTVFKKSDKPTEA